MPTMLEDPRNLRILLELCSGDAVSVNLNQLQKPGDGQGNDRSEG